MTMICSCGRTVHIPGKRPAKCKCGRIQGMLLGAGFLVFVIVAVALISMAGR